MDKYEYKITRLILLIWFALMVLYGLMCGLHCFDFTPRDLKETSLGASTILGILYYIEKKGVKYESNNLSNKSNKSRNN